MNKLIKRLIDDHKHITKVHQCLKHEMHYYEVDEGNPNLHILMDAMDYLRNYPECFHHPTEDKVYAKMRCFVVDPFLLQMLDHIEMQHGQLQVLSRRLHGNFVAIANDQVVPTRRILSDFEAYIELAEEHLTCENKFLIPAIEKFLSKEDLKEIQRDLEKHSDPVFSTKRLKAYENLYQHIVQYESEAA